MPARTRFMMRDLVVTAPAGFSRVTSHDLERFALEPDDPTNDPRLFVLAYEAEDAFDLDGDFPAAVADLLGDVGTSEWSLESVQLLGYEARLGRTGHGLAVVVRGPGKRVWAFGCRSASEGAGAPDAAFERLLASVQARQDEVGTRLLEQQHKRLSSPAVGAGSDAAPSADEALPEPNSSYWDERLAAALGSEDPAVAASMAADAVTLVEEAFGAPVPIGASRIGGGPDLPAGVWPSDERGMRHPFLLQIDLAEVAAVCGGAAFFLPRAGLLSFFVHDDAPTVDAVYSPPDAVLLRHAITASDVQASGAAGQLVRELSPEASVGPLPHDEGDRVAAELHPDGTLTFTHSPDPVWAYGEAGQPFVTLSDERWASVASARLRPAPSRSFDFPAAITRAEESGVGSADDLTEIQEDFECAVTVDRVGARLPQVHRLLGHATFGGRQDCREEAARLAEEEGSADLAGPDDWVMLVRVKAGSVTGREFWDALDLTIMAPAVDVAGGRWDRCTLLPG